MNKSIAIGGAVLVSLLVGIVCVVFFARPNGVDTKEEAINIVIKTHPELAAYRTTSLPPHSIEVERAPKGWYVGFIQSGSGVSGVLHAECYNVSDRREVTKAGTYTSEGGFEHPQGINLDTCSPEMSNVLPHSATSSLPAPPGNGGQSVIDHK